MFFFNIPTNSYPFQWPLPPHPHPQLTWHLSSGRVYFKSPTDFLKIHQPVTWFIPTHSYLPAFKTSFASEDGPPKALSSTGNVERSPSLNRQAWGPKGLGRRCFPSLEFQWIDPQGIVQRLICLFRLSPEREDVSICSGPVYLFDPFFVSLALFLSCGNAPKGFSIRDRFF